MLETHPENPGSIEEGSAFDTGYRKLLWAVDVLDGDDPQSNSIVDHGMVDADARKHVLEPPDLYVEKKAGASNGELNKRHHLLDLPNTLRGILDQVPVEDIRKGVLLREIGVAEMRIRHSLAGEVDGVTNPAFEDLWKSVTGEDGPPPLSSFREEVAAIGDHIRTIMSRFGVQVTNSKTRDENMKRWEAGQKHFGIENESRIREIIGAEVETFLKEFKRLARRVPTLASYADRLNIEHYQIHVLPDMNFDAGLSYIGGVDEQGKPTGAANFEWNAGRSATAEDIRYITAHETTHMVNAQLMDLMRRDGHLGPEAALLTMSSPRAMNEEGLAQTMPELLHRGSLQGVITDLEPPNGSKMGLVILSDRLQDIARLVASIGWNGDFAHIQDLNARRLTIHEMIVGQLLQTDHIGNKYAGEKKRFWRELPGGQMYSPAYYYGSRGYRDAIENYGVEKVLASGMHSRGLVDLQAFKKKVAA